MTQDTTTKIHRMNSGEYEVETSAGTYRISRSNVGWGLKWYLYYPDQATADDAYSTKWEAVEGIKRSLQQAIPAEELQQAHGLDDSDHCGHGTHPDDECPFCEE